ncbi:MAG TPA: dephospho-CoA kinase [Fermentimonas caenicola]|jgi:dephospho-CoA kinase|nr:dephospho-CoA kinase [Fermentimonas sp.]MDI9625893.1 dephospho-CoA kinase [Bacteroidota bacterium]HHU42386.1 dephospho-CoA kinase [Fermentimonas caenicola]
MIRIGVTGGIGSGKSIVCDIFRIYDIPVFDADIEAKRLNDTSQTIRRQLIHHFGPDIYENDRLNRRRFAELIFSNDQNIKIANSIIHPVVADCFLEWCNSYRECPVVVIDAALLIEAGFNQFVDKVITVYTPEETRIERVMKRDGVSREQVEARMFNQMPEEEKVKHSDYVIYNDSSHSLIEQVSKILDELSFTHSA